MRDMSLKKFIDKIMIMMMVLQVVFLQPILYATNVAGEYYPVIVTVSYPDNEPAKNLLVIISYYDIEKCPYCIITKNMTNDEGITLLRIPRKYVGIDLYMSIILPGYNIYMAKNKPITINDETNEINIKLSKKPVSSSILVKCINEYDEPRNASIVISYNGIILYEGVIINGSITINETLDNTPIIESNWLSSHGFNPYYDILVAYKNQVFKKKIVVPSETIFIVDDYPPKIRSIDASISYQEVTKYVEITVNVTVYDGLNTCNVSVTSSLYYGEATVPLKIVAEVLDKEKTVYFKYSFIDLGGELEEKIRKDNVTIHVKVEDVGGHHNYYSIKPLVVFINKTGIGNRGTKQSKNVTDIINETDTFVPGVNQVNVSDLNASFVDEKWSYGLTNKEGTNEVLDLVVPVLVLTTIILEYLRRRM